MREMKDSGIPWVGKIPSQWKTMRGKYLFTNSKGKVGTKVNEYERLALTLHGVIKRSKNDTEGLQPAEFNTYQILRKNELVFKLIDLQNISTSRIGLSPYDGIVSPAYIILKAKKNIIPAFAEKYYLMMWINHIFNALGDSGVRSSLNARELLEINVPLPPIEEQRRIANYLDSKCAKIKSIKKNVEAEMEALKQHKRSIIAEAVTKGLDKNVEMKDSGIPWIEEIPENWTVMRTRNIAYISIGLVTTMTANYVGKEEGVPLIRNSNIKCNQISYENMAFLSNKFAIANQNRRLHEGQIVTVHTGDIGTSAIIPKKLDGCLGFATIQSTPNSQFINPKFLCWEYNSTFFKNQCIAYCTGDGRQNLNLYDFINLRVIVPPVHEQLEIASYLDSKCSDIDSIISDKQKQLEILNEYKKSLIYEYVTGKKEVPAV